MRWVSGLMNTLTDVLGEHHLGLEYCIESCIMFVLVLRDKNVRRKAGGSGEHVKTQGNKRVDPVPAKGSSTATEAKQVHTGHLVGNKRRKKTHQTRVYDADSREGGSAPP